MFSKFSKKEKRSNPKAPGDAVAYAIGDIHGCLDALKILLEKIETHAATHAPHGYTLVFLGDLIDRGPDSAGVVDYVKNYAPHNVTPIYIKGNHEEVFLNVAKGSIGSLTSWLKFGGRECLHSYGVHELGEINTHPEGLMHRVQSALPKDHIAFLATFQNYLQWGDYLFVHAGITPKKPLEKQEGKDLRWIRDPFLNYKKPHEFKVIHGHTVVERAKDYGNRVAVDTGAHKGGPLTAVFLKGETLSFIHSTDDAR